MPQKQSKQSSTLPKKKLPRLSNQQFDEVIELARDKNINLNACPTCGQTQTELAPGIWSWTHSAYKLYGENHDCDCEWQDNLRRHYLLSGIPGDYWPLSQGDFLGDPSALAATREYLDRWDEYRRHGIGVDFYSATQGTGKTMLATLIAKHLLQQAVKVYFVPFRDAVRIYSLPPERREAQEKRLRHTPVLILDEVGTAISEAQRGFFAAELEDLIRFRTSGNGVTIITTNLTPIELDYNYPRVFSLIASKQKRIEVKGVDFRRSGSWDLLRMELIANNEAMPLV